jgi:hypothetical protein
MQQGPVNYFCEHSFGAVNFLALGVVVNFSTRSDFTASF